METKQIAAIILILLAAGIVYYVLALAPAGPAQENGETPLPSSYSPPFAKDAQKTTMEEFAANLLAADTLYIVEDLRGLERYPLSRTHIMQCGVDYAGSPGLAGKEIVVYAFDDGDVCGTIDGTSSISECYGDVASVSEDPSTMMIWIEMGPSPDIYNRGIIVRINETYVQGACTTNLVSPQQEEPEEEPALPEMNVSEPVPEEPETNETAPEEPEEEEGPGDSVTFP